MQKCNRAKVKSYKTIYMKKRFKYLYNKSYIALYYSKNELALFFIFAKSILHFCIFCTFKFCTFKS